MGIRSSHILCPSTIQREKISCQSNPQLYGYSFQSHSPPVHDSAWENMIGGDPSELLGTGSSHVLNLRESAVALESILNLIPTTLYCLIFFLSNSPQCGYSLTKTRSGLRVSGSKSMQKKKEEEEEKEGCHACRASTPPSSSPSLVQSLSRCQPCPVQFTVMGLWLAGPAKPPQQQASSTPRPQAQRRRLGGGAGPAPSPRRPCRWTPVPLPCRLLGAWRQGPYLPPLFGDPGLGFRVSGFGVRFWG